MIPGLSRSLSQVAAPRQGTPMQGTRGHRAPRSPSSPTPTWTDTVTRRRPSPRATHPMATPPGPMTATTATPESTRAPTSAAVSRRRLRHARSTRTRSMRRALVRGHRSRRLRKRRHCLCVHPSDRARRHRRGLRRHEHRDQSRCRRALQHDRRRLRWRHRRRADRRQPRSTPTRTATVSGTLRPSVAACVAAEWVRRGGTDCDDGDATVGAALGYYDDTDGDGYGDGAAMSHVHAERGPGAPWMATATPANRRPSGCAGGVQFARRQLRWARRRRRSPRRRDHVLRRRRRRWVRRSGGHPRLVQRRGRLRRQRPLVRLRRHRRRESIRDATEYCDGVDNDCDGSVDDSVGVPGLVRGRRRRWVRRSRRQERTTACRRVGTSWPTSDCDDAVATDESRRGRGLRERCGRRLRWRDRQLRARLRRRGRVRRGRRAGLRALVGGGRRERGQGRGPRREQLCRGGRRSRRLGSVFHRRRPRERVDDVGRFGRAARTHGVGRGRSSEWASAAAT